MGMDIGQLKSVVMRRWHYLAICAVLFMGLAAAFAVLSKPVYSVDATILIDTVGLSPPAVDSSPSAGLNLDQSIMESQIYVLQSRTLLEKVADLLKLDEDRFLNPKPVADRQTNIEQAVGTLERLIDIERQGTSFVVDIGVKHRDAAMAVAIANEIGKQYLINIQNARKQIYSQGGDAFVTQARETAAKLREAEETLERFKSDNGIVSTGQQGLVIDQQVEGISKQLVAARADYETKRANYEQARRISASDLASGAIPESVNSTELVNLRARYADLTAKVSQMQSAYGAKFPKLQAARAELDTTRKFVEAALNRVRAGLKGSMERAEANLKALQAQLTTLSKSSLDTSEAGIRTRELQSEVDILRALYKSQIARSEELTQRDRVSTNNSRIISPAIPTGLGSQKLGRILLVAAAGLFGIATGCGLAVLHDLLVVSGFIGASTSDRRKPVAGQRESRPVIARFPVAASPKSGLLGALSRKKPVAANDIENAQRTRFALTSTVDAMLQLAKPEGPVTLIFLPADGAVKAEGIVPRIAEALAARGKSVCLTTGEGADGTQTGLDGIVLADKLAFRRIGADPDALAGKTSGQPTWRQFSRRFSKTDFVLLDATQSGTARHLETLLLASDAIVLIEPEDATINGAIAGSLGVLGDRVIGRLVMEQAA